MGSLVSLFAISQLIELSIGAFALALAVMLKGIDVGVDNPLNRERLVLFPYAAVVSVESYSD